MNKKKIIFFYNMSYLFVYALLDKAHTSSLQIRLISTHCSNITDIYRTWYGHGTDLVRRWRVDGMDYFCAANNKFW